MKLNVQTQLNMIHIDDLLGPAKSPQDRVRDLIGKFQTSFISVSEKDYIETEFSDLIALDLSKKQLKTLENFPKLPHLLGLNLTDN